MDKTQNEASSSEKNKKEFFNEIREISDEYEIDSNGNEKIVIEDENVKFSSNEKNEEKSDILASKDQKENLNDENDMNDDLLQIPAFLRRQAN